MIEIDFCGNKKNLLQFHCDGNELEIIRDSYSVPNPAYISKKKFIPSRLYAITPTGRFDSGLLPDIESTIKTHGFPYRISEKVREYLKNGPTDYFLDDLALQYRDYQKEAIQKAISARKGIILVGTGGGKTLLTAGLILNLRKYLQKPEAKVLITVPTLQLVEQTAGDFEEYGLTGISKWSGKNKLDPTAKIIVAGTQYLVGKNTDLSLLSEIDIFIADEAHVLRKSNELNRIFKFIETPYTFGLTGTMPSSKIDQWNMIGKLGPIIYEKKTTELKSKEYVSDFHIYILNMDHKGKSFSFDRDSPSSKYQKELEYLMSDQKRNELISNLSLKLSTNTVIMVDRIVHGETLYRKIKEKSDKNVYFIRGSTEIEDREKIRDLMNERNDIVVIAISKIFSTGINIPNLHNIIFASAGKAKIKIIQSIGRSLRLHPTKQNAKIFDIADNTFYGSIHKEDRKALYLGEKYGYTEKDL